MNLYLFYKKNMNNEYKNYYKHHSWYNNQDNSLYLIRYYNKNFKNVFKNLDIDHIKVLEIGCWKWTFAKYCDLLWIKNYYWFDLDKDIISLNKKLFINKKWFVFSNDNVLNFMDLNKNFDIIFMSHVFEHFTHEQSTLYIEKIYKTLKNSWIYINIMPNAWSLFSSSILRYADNTHKKLYTDNSFNQVLLSWGFLFENIKNLNSKSWPYLLMIVRIFIKYIIKFFIRFMWYSTSNIDTLEIITFAKK